MIIHCKYDELIDPSLLEDHPKNRNQHGQDQIDRLADLYKFHGVRHSIIVSSRSKKIVAGHGRKLAAIRAGLKEFPVVYQDFESEEAEYAFLIADNAIADWSELDHMNIKKDILDLGSSFDIKMLGLFKLDLDKNEKNLQDIYTDKIEAPIYKITGERPNVKDLVNLKKSQELLKEIKKNKNLSDDERAFLELAAGRHVVFNYGLIAEYYAHANKEVQELMENSALVIIDFKKAIENGFIKLTKDLANNFSDSINESESDDE